MFIDSHCHLNFPELKEDIDSVLSAMRENQVSHALCVSVDLPSSVQAIELAEKYGNLLASVGVHPDYEINVEPTQFELTQRAQHPKVVAIGETGLDYFRLTGELEWQRVRFRRHIQAAIACNKPLIIHTRQAAADTLRIMREEHAERIGGVMHCFTESLEVAYEAIDLGFLISFSGILTFKNAASIREVARQIPLDRILIETDSPYLAPVPFRGKTNQPAYVKHVAETIAQVRNLEVAEVGRATTENFIRLFRPPF
ncbi:MAG: TatD family hydrolase [Gallionella sp.]|nr:TatD family hydrolase [Gallionella sp.]PIR10490.1 MAG: DNAase [Gallionellaceae bacterium CG11_big_fil_rev_8_21_14_0_20_60_62]PIV47666.1 MAG: DNAase [Gallionellaceae bacterium CG02_land_8_20_14_3_00_60_115]PJC05182.1 MAG: DNAase [Gallionellaceae bacterium CG_4_9_14_0_8_um_filter_60_335]HCJ50795.1 DNAase [Gallionella sp.]